MEEPFVSAIEDNEVRNRGGVDGKEVADVAEILIKILA
jgi:hypothetical protein